MKTLVRNCTWKAENSMKRPGIFIRAATLQKCGVICFSVFLCQRCREIWREISVKFSACYVFQGLGVRSGIFHQKLTPKTV